jgi:hypothetical protein
VRLRSSFASEPPPTEPTGVPVRVRVRCAVFSAGSRVACITFVHVDVSAAIYGYACAVYLHDCIGMNHDCKCSWSTVRYAAPRPRPPPP